MRFAVILLCFTLIVGTLPVAANEPLSPEVVQVLERLVPRLELQLRRRFEQAGVEYPPARLQLISLKQEQQIEVWAADAGPWRHIHDYQVLAASGVAGPKLREGDRQVPEGFYQIEALNPHSRFHLSIKLNFPNSFDWLNAHAEGRRQPGSNIFIHGSAWSVGCLAIGDQAVEELFLLVARSWQEPASVMILPYDFRCQAPQLPAAARPWVAELYSYLQQGVARFPLAAKAARCESGCGALASAGEAVLP
ncbi:L,D-transpeptidase family protein [Candidatus Endoriftia persephonae]|jgi:hypothetical protein|uniref:L,D-transpeptidase family protein n=1 Tax=Candidatus Endoriftia persephonae TaxID=393765 RepID=A0A9J6ZTY5_9GAMM|nr:L,D-transpeptidase family protein [Candidatus Endoriftia persephone]USF86236.1 L,D-transpeptidase family protein [Candidatus Endoriftia persephone]